MDDWRVRMWITRTVKLKGLHAAQEKRETVRDVTLSAPLGNIEEAGARTRVLEIIGVYG